MGLMQRLVAAVRGERKDVTSSLELFREIYGGRPSRSGVNVNALSALEVPTVLGCCRVIAEGVAQVPFRLYQQAGGKRIAASSHPLYDLLRRAPNEWQTSFEFRETIVLHMALTGNAYCFVNRVGSARRVAEIVPIEPGRVTVKRRRDQSLEYRVQADDGAAQIFGAEAIWHLRGPSWNSWMGMDGVKLAREAIGLTISLEQGQAEFQKGGAKTSGVLAVKDKLSKERYEQLGAWLDKHLPGGERFGKPIIVDDGATYASMMMSAVDQQLVETRRFQIEEICRAFRVMPIMVGAVATPTYASAEQLFLAHVIHTLTPWYERIEHSADVNLLTPEEREAGFYSKFTPNALMRGAAADRAKFYASALGSGGTKGWMTQNEVRDLEELDHSDDPEADELPQPTTANPAAPVAAENGE